MLTLTKFVAFIVRQTGFSQLMSKVASPYLTLAAIFPGSIVRVDHKSAIFSFTASSSLHPLYGSNLNTTLVIVWRGIMSFPIDLVFACVVPQVIFWFVVLPQVVATVPYSQGHLVQH